MGAFALRRLKAKRYFGLSVFVYGAMEKPKSCLIDGLQLATGATFGKGNISKLRGARIEVVVQNKNNKRGIRLGFKSALIKKLKEIKTHEESEVLAKELYRTASSKLFEINSKC